MDRSSARILRRFPIRFVCTILGFALAGSGCVDDVEDLDANVFIDGGSIIDAGLEDAGFDVDADTGTGLYPADRPLEVSLTVAPADWDRIRAEGRSINQVFSGCSDPNFAYSFVPATLHIDGVLIGRVGLRKKGYLGSLSMVKPSLRIDVGEYAPEQSFRGQKDLVFNNSRSDASLLHTCLAYSVFGAARIPVPRCSFAHVVENDRDLGLYVQLEPLKKPLLRRYFQDDSGNLYEGNGGSDFRSDSLANFEKKTNEQDPDRSDLERVREALEGSGAEMLAKLEPLVDVEQFMRFWATETLLGMWDGYSGDLNNFYVYHDPTSGKLNFLPWGTDDAFARLHPFLPAGERPVATYAWSRLPARLYAYEPTRRRYHEILRQLLDSIWNEPQLLAEIDRMAGLVGASAGARELAALRAFVSNRRADIERELAAPDAPWTVPERAPRVCKPEANTAATGTFSTSWGSLAQAQADAATTLELTIDGKPQVFTAVLAGAGAPMNAPLGGGAMLRLTGQYGDGNAVVVQFTLGTALPAPPGEMMLHGFETVGYVFANTATTAFSNLGYIGEGKIAFDQLSPTAGAPLVGRFEGKFVQTRPSPFIVP